MSDVREQASPGRSGKELSECLVELRANHLGLIADSCPNMVGITI
jgi:hypothetical protein